MAVSPQKCQPLANGEPRAGHVLQAHVARTLELCRVRLRDSEELMTEILLPLI